MDICFVFKKHQTEVFVLCSKQIRNIDFSSLNPEEHPAEEFTFFKGETGLLYL